MGSCLSRNGEVFLIASCLCFSTHILSVYASQQCCNMKWQIHQDCKVPVECGQKEGQSSPVLVAESWGGLGIYVPNLSHAETRSLKPSSGQGWGHEGGQATFDLEQDIGQDRSDQYKLWGSSKCPDWGKGGPKKSDQTFKRFWEELKPYAQRQRSRWIPVGYLAVVNPQITPHTLLSPRHHHLSSNLPKKLYFSLIIAIAAYYPQKCYFTVIIVRLLGIALQ